MPHECTSCGHAFPDGSKEMLSGCPECGGNKFQFIPPGTSGGSTDGESGSSSFDFPGSDATSDSESATTPSGSGHDLGSPGRESESGSGDDIIVADEEPPGDREDRAQASARSAVVSEDELPPSDLPPDDAEVTVDEGEVREAENRPDLSELREELNDQFESIKILQPGEYELNLMELYDREERIIALEEDGRYAIDVPASWRDDEE